MIEKHHRHILWDWNGTLLDDVALCVEILNAMLDRRGMAPVSIAQYQAIFDFPIRSFYERLGFDFALHPFETLSHEFISEFDARGLACTLHDGTIEILAAVTQSGRAQSILSAHRQTTLHEIVAHHAITPHFVHIAGLDDIYAHSKIERGRTVLAELALPPNEVLLIGDTLHDLEVAHALGIDCALVAAGHHPADRLHSSGARVFADLRALARAFVAG